MADKRKLLGTIIGRMRTAQNDGRHLEAAWYAYAILEDRLRSALQSSGGEIGGSKKKPLGDKLAELIERAKHSAVLADALPLKDLVDWKDARNHLMHSMLDGSMSEQDIDQSAEKLSLDGLALVKKITASAMRLKKHSAQTPSLPTAASKVPRAQKGKKKRGQK